MARKRRIAVMMDLDKIYKRHVVTFAGIQNYAQQADWHLVANDWADRMLPTGAGKPSPYDGLIGRITKLGASRAHRLDLPVVNVWFNSPNQKTLPGVYPDYAACGRERAEHLLSRGFQNLGILTHAQDAALTIEADVFETAAREAGCQQLHRISLSNQHEDRMGIGALDLADYADWKQAMRLIERWMNDWELPIGLFIFDVTIARLVIEQCEIRGYRIPEDVAIVAGFNDEVECDQPLPSISSLELPNEKVGYEAARMLDELIDEKENRSQAKGGKAARTKSADKLVDKPVEKAESTTILVSPVGVVARQSTDFHAVDDQLVRKALGYIDTNLQRPIVIDDIADYVGVSRGTLINRFRESLGRSINNELQRLRIERIKRELVSSDLPINQIAPKAGFNSVRTLNKVFTKLMGCTPSAFRKRAETSTKRSSPQQGEDDA